MAKFYGIGVGPGDKELLTIKAAKILSAIDVLILPESKKDTGSIAFEIAKEYIQDHTEIIYLEFPMVMDVSVIHRAGEKAAQVVEENVINGKNTAFITLGDPSIYSTYGYILKYLPPSIEVNTIPGITSFCAAAAVVNEPLVEGKEILSIIPATAEEESIEKAMQGGNGFAFMKVYSKKDKVLEVLDKHNLEKTSVLIKRCGFEDCVIERNIREELEKEKQYLSIILAKKEQ